MYTHLSVSCAQEIARKVFADDRRVDWPTFNDSEEVPCPIFFGEHPDRKVYCGKCGKYLYGEDPEIEE